MQKSLEGIIVAADRGQEWLLPWWWEHYSRFNAFPVAFVDFGMSKEARIWCRERGELIPLCVPDLRVTDRQEIDPLLAEEMENALGIKMWTSRGAWFKKPFACLEALYERSVWIDLDCQVCAPLESLFAFCEHPSGIALAQESTKIYNSGVIVFKRGAPLLKNWADHVLRQNHQFAGDQDVLSAIIYEKNLDVAKLPRIYNWSRSFPENAEAIILHWHGYIGKMAISERMEKNEV